MDTPTSVMLDIDGTPTPITGVVWLWLAPCGCCTGLTEAAHGENGPVVTSEQAIAEFDWPPEKVRRLTAAGHRMVARRRQDIGHDVYDQLKGKCPHDPPYGQEQTIIPGGYAWAARAGSTTRHLVPGEEDHHHSRRSLCGRVQGWWITPPLMNHDTVECTHCQREANKLHGGAA